MPPAIAGTATIAGTPAIAGTPTIIAGTPAIAGTATIAGTPAIARKLRTGMNGPVMGACAPYLIWHFP
jgi:hypothetical protein